MKCLEISVLLLILNSGSSSDSARQYDVSYGSPAYKHCVCGQKNYPLVGDPRSISVYEIEENKYPWIALITGNNSFLYSGSLINDRYIITLAHTLQPRYIIQSFPIRKTEKVINNMNGEKWGKMDISIKCYRMNELKVTLGKDNICQQGSQTVIFSIEKIIQHPEYNSLTNYANIVLMKLNMRVTFNEYIRPICLPPFDPRTRTINKYRGKSVTTLGWGSTDAGGGMCNQEEIQLDIFRSRDCETKITTIFCAGIYGNGPNGCTGESGSPLHFVNSKGKYELIGITLRGFGCGSPGIYTDVPNLLSWIIKTTTRDSMYCWR